MSQRRAIRPIGDRLIVRPSEKKQVTEGGLHLPTGATIESTSRGLVMDAGPGRRDINGNLVPLTVFPGDIVIFPTGAGTEFEVPMDGHNVKLLLMAEEDVFAVDYAVAEEEAEEEKKAGDAAA